MTRLILNTQELLNLKKVNPALYRKTIRMQSIEYRRREIERARALGHNFVNFTCLQTLKEAEAEIEKKIEDIEKEYTDANKSRR